MVPTINQTNSVKGKKSPARIRLPGSRRDVHTRHSVMAYAACAASASARPVTDECHECCG